MGRRDRAAHEKTHQVKINQITSDIAAADMAEAKRFHQDVLILEIVADPGWTTPTSDSGSPG